MTDDLAVEAYVRSHPKEGRDRIAVAMDVSENRARSAIARVRVRGNGKVPAAVSRQLTGAQDATAFIGQFDVVAQLRSALPELAGKVIYDSDLRASLSIDGVRWARVREMPEFERYQMKVRDRVVWAWPDTLEELRRKLDVL